MAGGAAEVLLSRRTALSGVAVERAEEFFRELAKRVRSRLIGRAAGEFRVEPDGSGTRRVRDVLRELGDLDAKIVGVLDAGGFPTFAAIVIDRGLLARIIGAMLGDADEGGDGDDRRPLSAVERRIANRVMQDVAEEIAQAWPTPNPPPLRLVGGPGGPRLVTPEMEQEEVYSSFLQVSAGDRALGFIAVMVHVEALRERSRVPATPGRPRPSNLARVMPIEVELVACLGSVRLTLDDLRALRPGDVVALGRSHEATVHVNGRPVLAGEAGQSGGNRSVRIRRRVG